MKLMGSSQLIGTVKPAETVSITTIVVKMILVMIDQMLLRMIVCLICMGRVNQSLSSMIA